ncbi:MAG: hypothetical protein KAS87_06450 [Candidatus Omnitrophica bacterium]|nr:hypothetical protein [Candidatus Omnitrophota bacterium]
MEEKEMKENVEKEKEGSEKEIKGGAEKQGKEIPKKKKKWVKPTITRVKLNPEMAVMGVCSQSAGAMNDMVPEACSSEANCREAHSETADATGCDNAATS